MKSLDSKIAVVGGGFSGLFIAAQLQKKGYKNVTVFEKEDRLGGKLNTIWYKGRSYELGALFGLPVQKNLQSLMKELNIKPDGPSLSRVSYDAEGNKILQIPQNKLDDFLEEIYRLPDVLEDYKSLRNVNIKFIEKRLAMPFAKWCDFHNLTVLKRIYTHHFSSYGLGDINEVPAVYVLRLLNFQTVMAFLEVPELFTWKHGVSSIVDRLSQRVKDLRLGQKVSQVEPTNAQTLVLYTEYEKLEFDQAIITAPLNQFTHLYEQDNEMVDFLKSIKYNNYTVYAFLGDNLPNGCGCVLENLKTTKKGHLVIWNSRWDSTIDEELLTVYAYNNPNHSKEESMNILKADLVKLGVKNPRLYQYKNWQKQGPYVESEVLQKGFYEKLESMQGKHNVFLAGEIMSTVSMENCIKYSNFLISKYF
ncbi:FAD-dependent oxidoreductase [Proteinivorax hydrogeniformans]|uniref:FAD-dependent oxidoreductase n=1 Tax=Proteinivorax hydrogeniformans TaxID=1826727 RepID=A0AAU8HSB9_9FIRM